MAKRSLVLGAALAAALAAPALAVQPGEMLDDPALEARAREISKEIRCPVCRNESIDDSNAGVAGDLRLVIRERLVAGDTDEEVVTYLTDRYGEYVLLKPSFSAGNLALWLAAPALLGLGGLAAWVTIRRSRPEGAPKAAAAPLSDEEKARLDALLKQD
ncbi:cytochrome c-type biogenesis protein [Rhodovulum sp. DZ06]|uniref:cytochrome c-type biogenesis protein n=1 Tax=Rhodovulum sp. DZ06 TaxID=3425126 RepID=UPI003D336499